MDKEEFGGLCVREFKNNNKVIITLYKDPSDLLAAQLSKEISKEIDKNVLNGILHDMIIINNHL